MDLRLPLEGLYLYLVRNGFPLSVQDYQDALSALQRGYGVHRREQLQWLCEALWAHTEEEKIRLKRLFQEFPRPTQEVIATLTGRKPEAGTKGEPPSKEPAKSAMQAEAVADQEASIVQFGGPAESGVGLPRAAIPTTAIQPFILTPRPVVSLRTLIVIWRRFRLARRTGPRVEIDIDATIGEQGRRGFLVEPMLIPARCNQARLLVLFDASPSMAPWRYLGRMLVESLESGRFGHAAMYYFNNDPGGALFETDRLIRPIKCQNIAKKHPGCALLVIGDAGAVRGHLDDDRVEGAREFIAQAAKASWHPIAWANPMPRRRWTDNTAQRIATLPGIAMFEFSEDGLVQAVDHLRGKANG
ncbi:MAG: hypothetical protein NTX45_07900 [Proteobacteria bacterium]|nr:hypothetical protein [Pseudomonadota bacterium]